MKYREIDVIKREQVVGSHFGFEFVKRKSSPKINDSHTQASVEEVVDFYIMYIPLEYLNFYRFYVELSASKYRKFNNNKPFSPKPIIFVTALNIFQNYHDFGIKEDNEAKKKEKVFEKRQEDFKERRMGAFSLDKRKYFLDSSIWHYYLPIENWNGKTFDENLEHILKAISSNYD